MREGRAGVTKRRMETRIEIEGMTCEHCVRAVKNALQAVPHVTDARVQIGSAVVVTDAPVSVDALRSAVAEEGYRIKP